MQATISNKLVKELKPGKKAYEVWDTDLRGFVLRVQPSGLKTYYCEYARHRRVKIADATVLSPGMAREEARKKIADYVRGIDPAEERDKARAGTLRTFLAEKYGPWTEANHRRGHEAVGRIEFVYEPLLDKKLADVAAWDVEKIRSARLKAGRTATTVNHDIDALRGALSKAVEWKLLPAHPLAAVRHSKVDRSPNVRYLELDEEARLRSALATRETRRRTERRRFNSWRRKRGYKTLPEHGTYTDHLQPLVLLALNTGMRRGELFHLRWTDVDLGRRMLTVVGQTAKSAQTRHIPLNDEAHSVLSRWRGEQASAELVFPGADGQHLTTFKTAWLGLMKAARVERFRFHDTRHDFASKLVMAGEDLNTVRELLGHADIKMTLRYAHLAPEHKAAAVAKLDAVRAENHRPARTKKTPA